MKPFNKFDKFLDNIGGFIDQKANNYLLTHAPKEEPGRTEYLNKAYTIGNIIEAVAFPAAVWTAIYGISTYFLTHDDSISASLGFLGLYGFNTFASTAGDSLASQSAKLSEQEIGGIEEKLQ